MCEATAYILKNGREEPLVEAVETMEIHHDHVKITSLFGEERRVPARVKALLLVDHKILLEPI
ncbi:MAG: RNA-binding protein, partial [Deltaproteobacteria bacterium]